MITSPICCGIGELPRRVDLDVLRANLQLAAGKSNVARAQNVFQIGGRHPIRGEALLRVIQVNLLRQHALAVNLGHLRSALNGSSHQIGEVVQLPVRVLISRHRGQPRFCLGGITDERGGPTIGMDLGAVQLLHHQPIAQCSQLIVAQWRADIGADEAAAFEKVWIGDILVLPPGLHDRNKSVADQVGETESGKAYTMLTRGCGARAPSAARVSSIALRIARARKAMSISLALGLAMVSIKAAVSPKSLLNWIGPAPWGSLLFSAFSLRLISENCFFGSVTESSSCT